MVYRLDPERLSTALPAGLRPRLASGHAIATVCYTRLGSNRLFRAREGRSGASDHLAYRFAVEREDGGPEAWIARRETSSWLEARCGAKLLRGEYGRSSFQVREDSFAFELLVEGEHGEEFYLRGEAAGAPQRSLFASGHALEGFLGEDRAVSPHDVFAPEADELDLARNFAPEPLAVFEARSGFLRAAPFGPGVELDSAWRLVTRRLGVVSARRKAFRLLPERAQPGPAMPAP